jgi:hypothetical protein
MTSAHVHIKSLALIFLKLFFFHILLHTTFHYKFLLMSEKPFIQFINKQDFFFIFIIYSFLNLKHFFVVCIFLLLFKCWELSLIFQSSYNVIEFFFINVQPHAIHCCSNICIRNRVVIDLKTKTFLKFFVVGLKFETMSCSCVIIHLKCDFFSYQPMQIQIKSVLDQTMHVKLKYNIFFSHNLWIKF